MEWTTKIPSKNGLYYVKSSAPDSKVLLVAVYNQSVWAAELNHHYYLSDFPGWMWSEPLNKNETIIRS